MQTRECVIEIENVAVLCFKTRARIVAKARTVRKSIHLVRATDAQRYDLHNT